MSAAIVGFCTGMIDFPGRLAMTLFFNGCNLNCHFCHNKGVVNGMPMYNLSDIRHYVSKMQKSFQTKKVGIVLSGGEPTIHPEFANYVQAFGHEHPLSLHTNGMVTHDETRGMFESVIVSLKPPSIVGDSGYLEKVQNAIDFYCLAEGYREIRIVDLPKYRIELDGALASLSTNGWITKVVQPNSMEGA